MYSKVSRYAVNKKKNARVSRDKRVFYSWRRNEPRCLSFGFRSLHTNPATSPIPTPPGNVIGRRLFKPLSSITCRMYYIRLVPLPIFHRVTVLAYAGSFLFGSFGCTHQNPATTPHPTTTRGRAVLSTIRITFLRLLKARKAGGRGHEASLPVFFCFFFFLHECKSIHARGTPICPKGNTNLLSQCSAFFCGSS